MSEKEPFDYGNKLPDGQFEHHPSDLTGEAIAPVRYNYIHKSCGRYTKMPEKQAQTYARNPKYYSHTFCIGCHDYYPIEQFYWEIDHKTLGEI